MRLHRHEHQRVASSLSRRLGRTGAHAERTSGVRSRMRHLLSHNPRHARGSGGDTSPSRLTHIPQPTPRTHRDSPRKGESFHSRPLPSTSHPHQHRELPTSLPVLSFPKGSPHQRVSRAPTRAPIHLHTPRPVVHDLSPQSCTHSCTTNPPRLCTSGRALPLFPGRASLSFSPTAARFRWTRFRRFPVAWEEARSGHGRQERTKHVSA